MKIDRRTLVSLAAMAPAWGIHHAFAQQYPAKPIKLVVAAGAGTTIDATARFFSEPLSKRLNVPVVVENKPGAGGLLGYQATAKAPADGYTLLLAGFPLYLLPLLAETPAPPYDALRDFVAVARVSRVPLAFVVPSDSPYRSMGELIVAMKAKPGDLNFSSQGVGSSAHICSAVFNEMAKTKAVHVAYKETSAAITDVAAGRISFTCQGSGGVLPLIQAGKLRALAVTGDRRWDNLPAVPTVAKSGVPGYEMTSWNDFVAPAATPFAVLQLLSDEITAIASTPQFRDFCARQIVSVDPVGHRVLAEAASAEAAKWKRIAELVRQ